MFPDDKLDDDPVAIELLLDPVSMELLELDPVSMELLELVNDDESRFIEKNFFHVPPSLIHPSVACFHLPVS